jgi:hypothetical protein
MEEIVGVVAVTDEAVSPCIGGIEPVVDDRDACL